MMTEFHYEVKYFQEILSMAHSSFKIKDQICLKCLVKMQKGFDYTAAHFMAPIETCTCGILHDKKKEVWGNLEIRSMYSCVQCQNLCDTIILSKTNYIESISFPLSQTAQSTLGQFCDNV